MAERGAANGRFPLAGLRSRGSRPALELPSERLRRDRESMVAARLGPLLSAKKWETSRVYFESAEKSARRF